MADPPEELTSGSRIGGYILESRTWSRDDATGGYTIEVNVDPFIDLAFNSETSASIAKPDERHRYTFACRQGQRIEFDIHASELGNIQPEYTLYDPFFSQKASHSTTDQVLQGSHTCDSTGTYVLVVESRSPDQRGDYGVILRSIRARTAALSVRRACAH